MGSNLFNKIKLLKHIGPGADFASSSRKIILSTAKKPHYQILFKKQLQQTLILSMAMGMAVILLVIVGRISSLPLEGLSPELIASLNSKDLTLEQENLSFNIQLASAKYYKESTTQVTMVLNNDLDSAAMQKQADNIDSLIKKLAL